MAVRDRLRAVLPLLLLLSSAVFSTAGRSAGDGS